MATPAVTENATIVCPFGGSPTLIPTAGLTSGGNKALNQTDVVGKAVSNCVSSAPCVTVTSCTPVSGTLTKGGVGVVLTTSIITGSTGHLFVITETQTALKG